MSEHRIVVLLRELHPQIWQSMSDSQRRIALAATDGNADLKTVERAFKIARSAK